MSDNLVRPTGRPGTVVLPTGGGNSMTSMGGPSLPGMGQRAANPYGAATDPLANLRQMVEGGMNHGISTGSGAVQWEQYGDSRFEDQAQRDLRNESTIDNDVDQIYLQKYSAAAVEFLQFVCARRGPYYEEYRNILANFCLNQKLQTPCAVRTEFINTLNRHPEMTASIARAAVPMYAQRLVVMAKQKPNGELDRREYLSAISFAVRAVLTMEMISWLCKSHQGRQYAFNLPNELKEIVSKLESFKDIFGVACSAFGVSNPYGGLVYDVKLPTRTDYQLIAEAETAYMYNDFSRMPGVDHQASMAQNDNGIQAMIKRNAAASRHKRRITSPEYHNDEDLNPRWNKTRSDLQNLTVDNKEEFDLHRFFHSIGKKNHYVIPESDWKKIKHVFRRHPDQPHQEETVLRGCFRIVIIDLEADSGWFSTIVRAEGMDIRMVLTNPEKLLPILESDSESGEVTVQQVNAEKLIPKKSKTLEIPLEKCEELVGIPLITVKEEVATNSSKKLFATVVSTNEQMTKKFPKENATAFNTVIWDTFTCESAADKRRLFDDLPFLFKDGEKEEGKPKSFYDYMRYLNEYFAEEILDTEVMEFIDERLTVMVKEWLVSSLGYDNNPQSPEHIHFDSIINDHESLDDLLREDSDDGWRAFNAPADVGNYLTEQLKLFTFINKYDTNEAEGLIQSAQKQLELTMERPCYVTVINKRTAPIADANGEPTVIKRSVWPEYFDLVEKGFEPTMGPDKDIRTTDKLIQFSSDENLWLFSYSAMDRNVATLRLVTRRASLLYLSMV